jgi:hypothetical protein
MPSPSKMFAVLINSTRDLLVIVVIGGLLGLGLGFCALAAIRLLVLLILWVAL